MNARKPPARDFLGTAQKRSSVRWRRPGPRVTLGCEDVSVVGAATKGSLGDGGIDVTGTLNRPGLPAIRLDVQAKCTSGGVGPQVITQLRGSIGPGSYGMVITTGHFTKSAREESSRLDRSSIRLVDGPELAHVLAVNGIGVGTSALALVRLDLQGLRDKLDSESG